MCDAAGIGTIRTSCGATDGKRESERKITISFEVRVKRKGQTTPSCRQTAIFKSLAPPCTSTMNSPGLDFSKSSFYKTKPSNSQTACVCTHVLKLHRSRLSCHLCTDLASGMGRYIRCVR